MTKDFDKLKLPPAHVERLKQIGREQLDLATKMRDAEQRLRRMPIPKRKRVTRQFVVLCAILRELFQPDGRVPDRIGKRELHRQITLQLWHDTWLRLIGTRPPEVPGRDAVDAARRALLNPPVAE